MKFDQCMPKFNLLIIAHYEPSTLNGGNPDFLRYWVE